MNPENATSPANLAAQVMPGMDVPARLWRSTMKVLRVALTATLIMTVVLLALMVWTEPAYSPASGAGYWMGVTGGSLMLVLLIYPLRKRIAVLWILGPIRHWFRLHLFAGITGPLIVLFHSTFRVGSFNAAIALASMLLVVSSGLIGRFLYRKIHNGLYGSRRTASDMQAEVAAMHERLQPLLGIRNASGEGAIAESFEREAALLGAIPAGPGARAWQFITLGWRRRHAMKRLRSGLLHLQRTELLVQPAELTRLAVHMDVALRAVQRGVQFSTYERLFALWHVIHVPFLVLLVITAVAHVVAVHAY